MVATPSLADGSYDVSAVQRVVQDISESEFDLHGKTLVIGCTTNPGDCQRIQDQLRTRGISVLYNPEFIAQGTIIRDLQHADMVLIGGEDPEVIQQYQVIYHKIQPVQSPRIHGMGLTAAELVKIGVNCFLTTKISYANMLGEILVRSGLERDVERALAAVGADSRVGTKYMRYGFGYGGPCLPRDNRAFAVYAEKIGLQYPLGTMTDEFNQQHTEFLIKHFIHKNTDCVPFYFHSITYKPHTDIVEESQQLAVALGLLHNGCQVYIEPSTLLPETTADQLKNLGGMFQSRADLDRLGVTVFDVMP